MKDTEQEHHKKSSIHLQTSFRNTDSERDKEGKMIA